jgi:hypothetical protein
MRRVMDSVEMRDRLAENLIMFIRQNKGTLSKKRRENEFKQLTDEEVASLETIVQEAFEGFDEKAGLLALPMQMTIDGSLQAISESSCKVGDDMRRWWEDPPFRVQGMAANMHIRTGARRGRLREFS